MVSKDRKLRMHSIAEVLVKNYYDIVCLQEVWSDSDFNMIKEKVSGVLPYSHYFYRQVKNSINTHILSVLYWFIKFYYTLV